MNNTVDIANRIFEDRISINQVGVTCYGLQYALAAWQNRNFGGVSLMQPALGVAEETGELAHAILKHEQKIRGYDDEAKLLEAVGDAVADIMIYMTHICTTLRLDMLTLYELTAREVMKRDWVADPTNGVCATEHKDGTA